MKVKLAPKIIAEIRSSVEPVTILARRLGISNASVTKYRRVRRRHLSDAECDAIVAEFLSGIHATETCLRYGISRATVYRIRKRWTSRY
jgi:transposase-like protein